MRTTAAGDRITWCTNNLNEAEFLQTPGCQSQALQGFIDEPTRRIFSPYYTLPLLLLSLSSPSS